MTPTIDILQANLDMVETNRRVTLNDASQREQNQLRVETARELRQVIPLLRKAVSIKH